MKFLRIISLCLAIAPAAFAGERVRGVVTLTDWAASRAVLHTSGGTNLWVRYGGKMRNIGDVLTAEGEIAEDGGVKVMTGGFIKNHGTDFAAVPRPVAATLDELQTEPLTQGGVARWFGRIVEIAGTVQIVKGRRSELFMLKAGEQTLPVHYSKRSSDRPLPADLKDGAQVLVKGSYLFKIDSGEIADARLWVNYSSDIAVLAPPPWWTRPRIAVVGFVAAGAVALLAVLALGWSRARRLAHERRAILRERQKVADRLHDTIDQHLAGVNFLLTAALADGEIAGEKRRQLEDAAHVLAEAKTRTRDMIMSLRTEAIAD